MEREDTDVGTKPTMIIQTTMGDLIRAIAEAAEEATVSEAECSELTQLVLHGLLNRPRVCLEE